MHPPPPQGAMQDLLGPDAGPSRGGHGQKFGVDLPRLGFPNQHTCTTSLRALFPHLPFLRDLVLPNPRSAVGFP